MELIKILDHSWYVPESETKTYDYNYVPVLPTLPSKINYAYGSSQASLDNVSIDE